MKRSKPRDRRAASGRLTKSIGGGQTPQRRSRATLRDVANVAGVSPMTVSNLINGRLLGNMRRETQVRIEAAIKRLGYRPHTMARNLRLDKQLSIGMIIIDDAAHYLADPFTTHIVAGLSNQLNSRGYALLLQGLSADGFRTSPLIRDIRTDAVCVLLSGPTAVRRRIVETLLGLGQPVVAFQERFKFPGRDICLIRQADREGGRSVAQEVLKLGARRLVMLVPEVEWPAIAERVMGVREEIRATGGGRGLRVVKCGQADFRDTQDALARDIEENGLPGAILAGNDQMGIAAMKLMAARGLKVPKDIAITGFNAFEFWQYTDPVLTTVRSPAYEMGAQGGEEILQRLTNGRFDKSEFVFPVDLQPGAST